MSVTRPPLDVQHQGQFWPWGATRKPNRSDFTSISPSALRAFRPPTETVGIPPVGCWFAPLYPVFISRGSKGPNGGPPVYLQGLLMLILACTYLYVCIFACTSPVTAAAGLCAASGTPPLFQTGLPLFLGLLHCSRLACSTSGSLWGLQGVHLLRLLPCSCLGAPLYMPSSSSFLFWHLLWISRGYWPHPAPLLGCWPRPTVSCWPLHLCWPTASRSYIKRSLTPQTIVKCGAATTFNTWSCPVFYAGSSTPGRQANTETF